MSRLPFWLSDAVLLGTQALTVALPARAPAWLARLPRTAAWALLPAASIVVVIVGIDASRVTADALSWFALIAVPVGAALALGGLARGGRALLAPLALGLLALAWADRHGLPGQAGATLLSALSAVALGSVLGGLAPGRWLKVGIVAMALVDVYLVGSDLLQAPNAVLNAAAPAPGLPQLQRALFGSAVIGYGDLFVAGLLGGVLAAEGRDQGRTALMVLVLAAAFDLLFLVVDELPATVPVAVALLVREGLARRALTRGRSDRPISATPAAPASRREA